MGFKIQGRSVYMEGKKMKIGVLVLLCLLLLICACACLGSGEQQKIDGQKALVGTWKYDKAIDETGAEVQENLSNTLLSVYEDGTAKLSLEEVITVDLTWEYINQDREGAYYQLCKEGEDGESNTVIQAEIVSSSTKDKESLAGYLCLENDEDAAGAMLAFIKTSDEPTERVSIAEKAQSLVDEFQSTTDEDESATVGEKQALGKAYDYLEYTAFSYTGLIEQLEFEGFSNSEATYAADNCGADWNEQAALKAQQYLEYSTFSRSELIDQLEFEGFTHSQAVYGAEQNGY